MRFRNAIAPVVNLVSAAIVGRCLLIGLMIIWAGNRTTGNLIFDLGVIFFAVVVLFHTITLPVEFNASSRAVKQLQALNVNRRVRSEGCEEGTVGCSDGFCGRAGYSSRKSDKDINDKGARLMDINRKTAYLALMDVESRKAVFQSGDKSPDRTEQAGFAGICCRELVYGVLENKLTLDYYIDQLLNEGIESLRQQELNIIRMGIYQLSRMDSVPEYAAVNESVVLAKRYTKGMAGLVNGVLREYLSKKIQLRLPDRADGEVEYLSIKYSYAPWIVQLWLENYSADFVEALLKAGNVTPPMTVRLNWLKVMKQDLIKKLEEQHFSVEEGRLCQNALNVKGSRLLDTEMYKLGMFTPQDESSMLVAEKLDPKHGELVMDVCAAPGGKTTAIAERITIPAG